MLLLTTGSILLTVFDPKLSCGAQPFDHDMLLTIFCFGPQLARGARGRHDLASTAGRRARGGVLLGHGERPFDRRVLTSHVLTIPTKAFDPCEQWSKWSDLTVGDTVRHMR